MAKKPHLNILAKMLASFARDAEPEEIEEAVNTIEGLTGDAAEQPVDGTQEKLDTIVDLLQNPPTPAGEETTEDEDPEEEEKPVATDSDEKLDKLIALAEQILAAQKAKGTDEEEEVDPLKKLEDDLDEIEEAAGKKEAEDDDEEAEEEEETFAPDEDPEEPDSHFVDPEEINEQDEDEAEEEEIPAEKPAVDKHACDAMRAALKAVKPVIAKLPPSERRSAADQAVKSLRKAYGLSATPSRNDYVAIKRRKVKASDAAAHRKAEAGLAEKIMKARNVNYQK